MNQRSWSSRLSRWKTWKGVPKDILSVLEKYSDVMFDSLHKSLPSRRMIDHEIELLSGAKPPTKNSYRMTPPKLSELQKQLKKLLSAEFIRLAKTPNGAQSFSIRRMMEAYGYALTTMPYTSSRFATNIFFP